MTAKTIIIPDIHNDYFTAEKIIKKENPDKIIFLGDYFDDFDDTVKDSENTYTRLSRNDVSSTIVPGNNALPIHPTLNRTLTIREAARIQTFPDNFEFVGPIVNQGLQVGNAFSCLVAQIVGERLRTVVNKNWNADRATNLAKYSMLEK